MKKSELEQLVKDQENKISILEQDVDYWQHEYNELQEKYDDLECEYTNLTFYVGINDINNFIWRLKIDGLYTDALKTFIEEYLDIYNEVIENE